MNAKKILTAVLLLATLLPTAACSKQTQGDVTTPADNEATVPEADATISYTRGEGSLLLAAGETVAVTLSGRYEILSPDDLTVTHACIRRGDSTTVTLTGRVEGSSCLLAVSESGESFTIPLTVWSPAPEGESVNRALTAKITCNPANSPAAEQPAMLGDGSNSTKWLVFADAAELTFALENGIPRTVSRYTLTSANDDPGRDPAAWVLEGSADGENWAVLDSRSDQVFRGRHTENSYEIEAPAAFAYYRLRITQNSGDGETQLAEVTLWEVGSGKAAAIPDANVPRSLTLSASAVCLVEGTTVALAAEEAGVYFAADNSGAVLLIPTAEGVTVWGHGSGDATVWAFTPEGAVAACKVHVIGEGSYLNCTTAFAGQYDKSVKAAFDDDRTTSVKLSGSDVTVEYTMTDALCAVNRYAIVSGTEDKACDPKSWTLEGSVNGTDWVLLDSRSDEIFQGRQLKRVFDFENTACYTHFRLHITSNNGGDKTVLTEIQLFENGPFPDSWALGNFVKLDGANPILLPNTDDSFVDPVSGDVVYWSNEALYNPTAVVKDGVIAVLYRSQDHPLVSRVGLALSTDGVHFDNLGAPVLYPDNDDCYPFEIGGGCEDPRVVRDADGTYYMYYTAYNRPSGLALLFVATSTDLIHWEKQGGAFDHAYNGKYASVWAKSGSVICDMVGDQFIAHKFGDGYYYMYYGEGTVYIARSTDLINWTPLEDEAGHLIAPMSPRADYFDARLVECGPQAIYSEYGILLIYNGANADPQGSGDSMLIYNAYCPGQVLFDPKDPTKILERTETYFLYPEKDYELDGLVNNVCFVEGLVYYDGSWYLYYGTADSRLAVATYTPDPRDDSALNAAIAAAETANYQGELLSTAYAALQSAYYKQAWVDDIAARLTAEIG